MPSKQDRDHGADQGGNEGLEQHEYDGGLDFFQAGGEAHEEVHTRVNHSPGQHIHTNR